VANILFYNKVNGSEQVFDIHQYSREQVQKWLEFHRTRNGKTIMRLIEPQHTDNPSVQGIWTPFMNKPTSASTKQYPSDDKTVHVTIEPTQTEKIVRLYNEQQVKNIVAQSD
jgi:large subunit ribosomal protein L43